MTCGQHLRVLNELTRRKTVGSEAGGKSPSSRQVGERVQQYWGARAVAATSAIRMVPNSANSVPIFLSLRDWDADGWYRIGAISAIEVATICNVETGIAAVCDRKDAYPTPKMYSRKIGDRIFCRKASCG